MSHTSAYWKFGGSTVVTEKRIRLTPNAPSKQGWIWNEHALDADDFEVEVQFRVGSQSHFGGDGFALWILDQDLDPMYHPGDPTYLSGSVFGLTPGFVGFGVVFDTYDNDGMRDNPSIYVVQNWKGDFVPDHDTDLATQMIRDVPSDGAAHQCFSMFRNARTPFRALIRYQRGVLHVYVSDSMSRRQRNDKSYRYCLSVNVQPPSETMSHKHLAFTGMTGQLSDTTDILEITTRYLDEKDIVMDDTAFQRPGTGFPVYWLTAAGMCGVLLHWGLQDLRFLGQLHRAQTNPVYLCKELNTGFAKHFLLHLGLALYLLLGMQWLAFLLQLPLAAYRIYTVSLGTHLVEPATLAGGGRGRRSGLSFTSKLHTVIGCYAITMLYSLVCLF